MPAKYKFAPKTIISGRIYNVSYLHYLLAKYNYKVGLLYICIGLVTNHES